MDNPEKIEIEGLKTIHKLCKFGADHNMEGCSFTEIVERMFSKIEQMKTQVNTLDGMLLNQGEALAQAKAQAVPEISNKIVIGTQVKIINPDDTSEYGVVTGDEGVVVWVGEFGTVFGVCIPKKGDVWSFESSQLEITSNLAKANAVPDGFVLVNRSDLTTVLSNCSDAMMGERTSTVYDQTDEPSTWFDHHVVAETNLLLAIGKAQEPSHD